MFLSQVFSYCNLLTPMVINFIDPNANLFFISADSYILVLLEGLKSFLLIYSVKIKFVIQKCVASLNFFYTCTCCKLLFEICFTILEIDPYVNMLQWYMNMLWCPLINEHVLVMSDAFRSFAPKFALCVYEYWLLKMYDSFGCTLNMLNS